MHSGPGGHIRGGPSADLSDENKWAFIKDVNLQSCASDNITFTFAGPQCTDSSVVI